MCGLRGGLIIGTLVIAGIAGAFVVKRHLGLATGVRVTIETRSVTNATCQISWTTSEEPSQARCVPVLIGEGSVRVDLPVKSYLTGLSMTAPGVSFGRVTVLGDRQILRCETVFDLPAEMNLPALRIPYLK